MKLQLSSSTKIGLAQKTLTSAGIGIILLAGIYMMTTGSIQEISGVINDYAKVSHVSNDSLTVLDASDFAVNDKVLIIQMKGAIISEVDDANYGNVTDWGSVGVYEFNYIKAKSGNTLVMNHPPCKSYDPAHAVQLIRVPEYDSVRVTGTLEAQPWDGSTGGVLVLSASHRVRVDANLSAQGMGFEGGAFNGSAKGRSLTYVCDVSSGMGGRKGEGIVEVTVNGCRGKLANGGGGGNDHNGGGGGGGNYGAGGEGGHGWKSNSPSNLSDLDKGGRGGFSLENIYDDGIPRLFMGGGGGGGHQNNGASYPGGSGGGVIIVETPELVVESSVTFDASGEDAQDITINDGSSGGGAGGAILLDIDSYINASNLSLTVDGGDGADITTANQHGPGGGGGAGLINSTASIPGTISTSLAGGAAGIFYTSSSSHVYDGTTHGAAAGQDGAILTNLVIQKCSNPPTLDLNGEDVGTDFSNTFYPNGPDQALLGDEAVIADQDDVEMTSASVEIINPVDGSNEYLSMGSDFDSQATGITASVASDGHSISMSGVASLSNYQNALSNVKYNDTATMMDTQDRYISMEVNDGGASSNSPTVTLSMSETYFPVEWLYFQVKAKERDAILEWGTATENNSQYFEVQRSADGLSFDRLSQLAAAGNSQQVRNYQYTDKAILASGQEEIYYRLRQVDIDGQFEYSTVISINAGHLEFDGFEMKVPNPISGNMPISLMGSGQFQGKLSLLSLNGQLQREARISGDGFVSLSWDVSGLVEGMYVLNFRSGNQQISKKILVKAP